MVIKYKKDIGFIMSFLENILKKLKVEKQENPIINEIVILTCAWAIMYFLDSLA